MTMQFEKKHLKQAENQSQSGRSMVEMLGVLAVIGVLSLGGIAGYRLAMNHYQANQIAYEMNMMRTDARIKIAQGTEKLTLGEPYDEHEINFNNYGTTFDCALADESVIEENVSCRVANAYYIEMKNISQEICRPLSKLIQGMNELIGFEITTETIEADNEECQEGNNNIHAVFSAEAVSELKACKGVEDCDESGSTPYCDLSRHVCVRCYEDSQCAHTEYCEDNTCKSCDEGLVWNGTDCKECTGDDDCQSKPDTPVCNRAEYKCVECLTYEHCAGKEGTPQCDEASHTCKSCFDINPENPVWADTQCVECVESTDCAETLVCKENTCSPCEKEEECQEKGTDYHCSKEDKCIQCPSNLVVWGGKEKGCVECLSPDDCKNSDKPLCDTTTNTCIECETNAQCTEKGKDPHCHIATHTCEPCPDGSSYNTTYQACAMQITPIYTDSYPYCNNNVRYYTKNVTDLFGPFTHSYKVWFNAMVDDYAQFYVNNESGNTVRGTIQGNYRTDCKGWYYKHAAFATPLEKGEKGGLRLVSDVSAHVFVGTAWLVLDGE